MRNFDERKAPAGPDAGAACCSCSRAGCWAAARSPGRPRPGRGLGVPLDRQHVVPGPVDLRLPAHRDVRDPLRHPGGRDLVLRLQHRRGLAADRREHAHGGHHQRVVQAEGAPQDLRRRPSDTIARRAQAAAAGGLGRKRQRQRAGGRTAAAGGAGAAAAAPREVSMVEVPGQEHPRLRVALRDGAASGADLGRHAAAVEVEVAAPEEHRRVRPDREALEDRHLQLELHLLDAVARLEPELGGVVVVDGAVRHVDVVAAVFRREQGEALAQQVELERGARPRPIVVLADALLVRDVGQERQLRVHGAEQDEVGLGAGHEPHRVRQLEARDQRRAQALAAVLVRLVVDVVEVLLDRERVVLGDELRPEVPADQEPPHASLVADVRLHGDVEAVVGAAVLGVPGVAVGERPLEEAIGVRVLADRLALADHAPPGAQEELEVGAVVVGVDRVALDLAGVAGHAGG